MLRFCPFVNKYVHRHREYVDLAPEQYRQQFGLQSPGKPRRSLALRAVASARLVEPLFEPRWSG